MSAIEDRLAAGFRDAGVAGWLHAIDLDGEREVGLEPDAPVVAASVFKVPVLVELYRRIAAGRMDASEAVAVPPGGRTPGSTGLSVMRDPITVSVRDLALLMMTVSDTTAADVLCDLLGVDAVNRTLDELGFPGTRLEGCGRDLHAAIAQDAGVAEDDPELLTLLRDPGVLSRLRVLDPRRTTRTTPRESTRLLSLIWRDEVADPAACSEMRRLLGLQVWPHRLASGFPFDDVRVSGKTGTLLTVRNEIGVVEYPDGGRYAVAVYTRSAGTAFLQPRADASIGAAARLAIDHLRRVRAPRPVSPRRRRAGS
jgi:beta-lactamase class A